MDTGVYIRRSSEGIALLPGAEVIEDWDGGCLIRSEEKLGSPPGVTLALNLALVVPGGV